MVAELHTIAPNMSFTQKAMEQALQQLAVEQQFWKKPESNFEGWHVEMTKRVRTLCRHVAQILWRSSPPGWWTEAWAEAQARSMEPNGEP
eukprot:7568559-Alexandrium_andersonii.AAC.1